jgi:hypothetical protein
MSDKRVMGATWQKCRAQLMEIKPEQAMVLVGTL